MSPCQGVGADAAASAPTETSPLVARQNEQESSAFEGIPSMANKMHLFVPAVGLGVFLVAIDQLITVAAYARIGNDLNALNSMSWIATSYFLTLTSFQPLYGKLSDIFGRKECLLFAYTVFGFGCLGCGLAQNMQQLCVSRAVAGIGGGGMSAVVSILLSDIVPLRERGIWQGYINIIYAAGSSTGAPLGGILADSIGWRWSFLVQAPMCGLAFISVYYVLDVPPPNTSHWRAKLGQIDFAGAFALVAAVISLLIGLDCGSNLGWSHLVTIASLCTAPVLFALFAWIEVGFASHPFAPGRIISDGGLFAGYLVNFFGVASNFGALFFLPLYFQAVKDYTAATSGALLIPAMLGSVIASVGSGWLIKKTGRFYTLTILSFATQFVSIMCMIASLWFRAMVGEVASLALMSAGGGASLTITLTALLANASTEDTAVVVACSYLFRSLGSSIGISISSAALQQVLRTQLAARLQDGDTARRIEERVRQNIDFIHLLPRYLADIVRDSYQVATMGALVPSLFFSSIAFLVAFWIREKSLSRK